MVATQGRKAVQVVAVGTGKALKLASMGDVDAVFVHDRVAEDAFRDKAFDLLKMFALADWGEELIESYSHGMKQRLIMCAALLHDPEVLVVDEPMVGLDPVAIRMVKNLFRDLARKGVAVFMSTHTLAVAEDICDRIGIIHRGRLIAEGTLDDLRKDIKGGASDLESVFINLTQAPDNPGEALAS